MLAALLLAAAVQCVWVLPLWMPGELYRVGPSDLSEVRAMKREIMSEWTHKKLVRRMALWLKNTKKMTVVISELTTRNSETPDVIGFVGNASSVLIECKLTRADFLADRKKWFRQHPEKGMGDRRYMAVLPDVVDDPEELPEGWGLLMPVPYSAMGTRGHCIRTILEPKQRMADKRAECAMLMSALRRLEIATAVYVVADEMEEKS